MSTLGWPIKIKTPIQSINMWLEFSDLNGQKFEPVWTGFVDFAQPCTPTPPGPMFAMLFDCYNIFDKKKV